MPGFVVSCPSLKGHLETQCRDLRLIASQGSNSCHPLSPLYLQLRPISWNLTVHVPTLWILPYRGSVAVVGGGPGRTHCPRGWRLYRASEYRVHSHSCLLAVRVEVSGSRLRASRGNHDISDSVQELQVVLSRTDTAATNRGCLRFAGCGALIESVALAQKLVGRSIYL